MQNGLNQAAISTFFFTHYQLSLSKCFVKTGAKHRHLQARWDTFCLKDIAHFKFSFVQGQGYKRIFVRLMVGKDLVI